MVTNKIAVVLGMHRSGTSLLMNFLASLGVDVGADLMPPSAWNTCGYWEHNRIYAVHEKILDLVNRQWNSPRVSMPLPNQWWRWPEIQACKSDLKDIVRRERNEARRLWGFKDPRTAILFPLWLEIFEELGLEPVTFLAVRHPYSVSRSLKARDNMSFAAAQILWLKTNINAVVLTRGKLGGIIDYDRWFTHASVQADSVLSALNPMIEPGEIEVQKALGLTVRAELRHHLPTFPDKCSPLVLRYYHLLCRWAVEGIRPAGLLQISDDMYHSYELMGEWAGYAIGQESIRVELEDVRTELERLVRRPLWKIMRDRIKKGLSPRKVAVRPVCAKEKLLNGPATGMQGIN